MPLVHIREVRGWHKLQYPVFNAQGAVLVAQGTPLTRDLAARLAALGLEWVHVCDLEMPDEHLKSPLTNDLRIQVLVTLKDAFATIARLYPLNLRELERDPMASMSPAYVRERFFQSDKDRLLARERALGAEVVEVTYRVADAVLAAESAAVMPAASNRNPETSLLHHSVDVALTAGMLAREFGYERDEVFRVVLGALFHDVGLALLPAEWYAGQAVPAPDERPPDEVRTRIRRLHTVIGYVVLKDQRMVDLLAAHVAYQHHEHQDGTGYPRGLTGPNVMMSLEEALRGSSRLMHRYANIVAVANAFDHLTAAPPGGEGLPPRRAVARAHAVAGTHLNRAVVVCLESLLPSYPVGSEVWVTHGEHAGWAGVVAQANIRRPDWPIVRLVFNREGKRVSPVTVNTTKDGARVSLDPPQDAPGRHDAVGQS